MIPGPDQVITCPYCNGLATFITLLSGNTFGSRLWTDGKRIAPMLPEPPDVVKCRHCSQCYWLHSAKRIGTIDRWRTNIQPENPDWINAQDVQEPDEHDYYQAIDQGLARNSQQEKKLRILAWWRRNDPWRKAAQNQDRQSGNQPGPWRQNLEALAALLSEDSDNSLIMKAEVFRQLGKFEAAQQLLDRVVSPGLSRLVQQFRSLCGAGDTCVREIQQAGSLD